MKSQSPARAEAGEIRNEGINTGTPWGSSAAAREGGDCPRLASGLWKDNTIALPHPGMEHPSRMSRTHLVLSWSR